MVGDKELDTGFRCWSCKEFTTLRARIAELEQDLAYFPSTVRSLAETVTEREAEINQLRAELATIKAKSVMPDVNLAAKALCSRHAAICGVDEDDQWKEYGQDFIADAETVLANASLTAAPVSSGDPEKCSYQDDPRSPAELSLAGCNCVRFGECNPHWPCKLHTPAGGGGLEVVAWRIGFPNNAGYKVYEQRQPWAYEQYGVPSVIVYEVQELCRLSDAQAIIDGLRGEVERLECAEKNDSIAYKAVLERQDQLRAELAATKAQGVVMPAELDRAFITGESCDGVYRVVIQSEKLKEMQAVHSWLTSLNAAPAAPAADAGHVFYGMDGNHP